MPTWRGYLKSLKKDELVTSQYFSEWNRVLTNERLAAFLEAENIDLIFYPHYEMQPHLAYFQSRSPRIKIADFANYDVQSLLKESAFLITDYSSVFFDFAYMRKPTAYYQFDQETFFSKHYQKGYFDYEKNGFGPVAKDMSTLIEIIMEQGKDLSKIKDVYYERCKEFFPLRDANNCERIFQEIERLKCN
jgi:CDP-glycerol glycerophosphotransferase (TagB/SpsB family)